jgi:hypothetical protein
MNGPQCAGRNFDWARKCDHCGQPFVGERPSRNVSASEQRPTGDG